MKFKSGTIVTHNGKVTINNPVTGKHRTFQVRTQPEDSSFAPGRRVVSLLNGPDNQHSYLGFGFVAPQGNRILVWKKKQGGVYDTYARMLTNPEGFQKLGAVYLFAGRCRRCNRELTVPTSVLAGIGPTCAELE